MTTLQQQAESDSAPWTIANRNAETLSAGGIFGKRQSATTGLTWAYYGGLYNGNSIADGTVTLTNAADNYVVVLRSTGVVSVSTSSTNSLDSLYAKLYKLTVAGSVVTVELDQRWDANGLLFNTSGVSGDMTLAGVQTVTGAKTFGSAGAVGKLKVAGTTSGAATIDAPAVAGAIVLTLPATTGTLVHAADVAAAYQPLDADLTAIAALADPNADRILFWDDSAGAYTHLTAGTGLTITGTTIDAAGGGDAYPAFEYTSETGSTADSDPGAGLFKWNNATQASATFLYFDDVTADSSASDLSTFFGSLGTSGFIHIINAANEAQFQVWKWSAITDGTGYWKFAVTLQVSSASLADAITTKVMFIGASGAVGQSAIQFKDEGSNVGTSGGVTTVNFVGADVVATESGGVLTVTITSAGASVSSKVASDDYTRPADTTTYAAGDVVAESTSAATILTFTSMAASNGGGGVINAAVLIDSLAQTLKPQFELWLFDTAPTMQNDNVAWAPSDAELEKLIGVIVFNAGAFRIAGANGAIHTDAIGLPYACAGGTTSLYGVLVARNAYVPGNAEKFTVRLYYMQD